MAKKSQATLFIMIGIVLMLVFMLLYYIEGKRAGPAEILQPELMPIKNYVEECVKITAKDGINRAGVNGGYITFPEKIENNPMSYMPALIKEARLPYWWYEGVSNIPTEEFIEGQIAGYVEKELKRCIDFNSLSQYKIEELEKPKAMVYFNEEDVKLEVNYPIKLIYGLNKTETRISKFETTVPTRIKKAYELAKDIMNAENKDNFIEEKTIDLMSMAKEIPITGVEITCSPRTWNINDIKKRLQELLRVNLQYINVVGTEFDKNSFVPTPYGNTYDKSYYNYHYKWKIGEKSYDGLKAALQYDEKWPIQIYARPSKNNILRSNAQRGLDMVSFLCLHIWHFTYDVTYPVKATIVDEKTEKHNEFVFNFPFKISIDHNYPNRVNFASQIYESAASESSEEFCNDASKEITIYTADKVTNEELPGVNLSFSCGRFRCDAGQSEWMSYGAAAGITKVLPFCVYGVLRGKKAGYADGQRFIQTDTEGSSYTLYMTPLKEIKKYSVVRHPDSDNILEVDLKEGETAAITIQNGAFESYANYPYEGELPINLLAKKDAVYNLTIYITDGERLIGGYKGEWNVNWNELENANEIKFHTISKDTKDDNEMAWFLSGLESYSNDKHIPKPEIK